MEAIYIGGGLLVGLLVGVTGVGGGALMTPMLVLLGVPPAVAVGTDLLFAALTKSFGVWFHGQRGNVQWRIAALLALGSLPAAALTAVAMHALDLASGTHAEVITRSLSVALILTSLALLFKTRLSGVTAFATSGAVRWRSAASVIAGAVLGVLVTLSSVGAGALGATLLLLLYPRLPTIAVVGTDIAHAVPLAATASLGHLLLGTVDFLLLAYLLVGSLPGIWLGSRLGTRLPEAVVRPILATLLMLIGLRLAL